MDKVYLITKIYKKAMPVPLSDRARGEMAETGVYPIMDRHTDLPDLPKTKIAEEIQTLKDSGNEFANSLDINTILQLPYISLPSARKNLVEIDGKEYLLLYVEASTPSKKAGTSYTAWDGNYYKKGDTVPVNPGEVILKDMENGEIVTLSHWDVKDKIKPSQTPRRETMEKLNKEIALHNKHLTEIDKYIGVERLALQVVSTELKIKERIQTLNEQLESLQGKSQDPLTAHPGYANWMNELEGHSNFSKKDIFDTLLFKYQGIPEALIEGLESNTISAPNDVKEALLAIAKRALRNRQEKEEKARTKTREKEERMESTIEESQEPFEAPLDPLSLEDIPSLETKAPERYKSLHSQKASIDRQIQGITTDRNELQKVLDTFSGLRAYVGALESGERSREYLKTEKGRQIKEELKRFLDASSSFFKRYSVSVVEGNKINPLLMGRSGSVGNAFIGIRLHNLYLVIKRDIEPSPAPITTEQTVETPPSTPSTPVTPQSQPERVASSIKQIKQLEKKISDALWQSFEKRLK